MIKKSKLSLVALAILTSVPLLGLTSCNNNNQPVESETEQVKHANVTLNYNSEGGVAKIGKKDYQIGDIITINISLNKGYSLAYVMVNNEKIRPIKGEYKFEVATDNVAIEVLFEKNKVIMSDFTFDFDRENMTASISKYTPDSRIVPYPFVVPESVTYGNDVFKITGIKKQAFSSSNIEKIVLSKNIIDIEHGTFSIVYGLKEIDVDKDNKTYASFEGALYNKDFSKLLAVPTGYDKETFQNKAGTSIIGDGAFINNHLIKHVKLTESVTTLEPNCFMDMASLEKIDLSTKIKIIPSRAFSNDNQLVFINIPEGIETIDEYAFYFCTELKTVTFPSTLKKISKEAFYRCQKLRDPTFNEGLEVIGKSAFGSCISLENIVLPNSLLRLEEAVFESCTNLTTCKLNEGLKYLGGAAFILTVSLKGIVIPASVTNIGYNPLIGAASATIEVNEANKNFKVVDGVLYSFDMAHLICVPHGLKTSDNTFRITSSVTHLDYNAFSMNLYLKKVYIPTSVISMLCAFQEILPNQVNHKYEMELFYDGTKEEFNAIDAGEYPWNYKANFAGNIITCSDGEISLTPQLGN